MPHDASLISLSSLPEGLRNLSSEQLSPHSKAACLELGIAPRELLQVAAFSVAEESIAATNADVASQVLLRDRRARMVEADHVETRRQEKLESVLHRRDELAHSSRSHGSKHRSSQSSSSNDYVAASLDKLARSEARRKAQIAEKQKRDLALLVHSEIRHARAHTESQKVYERVQSQRSAERARLAAKARENDARRMEAESRIEAEARRLREEQDFIYDRDIAEREAVRKRRELEEQHFRAWGKARDDERRARLEAIRKQEHEVLEDRRVAMRTKMQDIEIRVATVRPDFVDISQVSERVGETGYAYKRDPRERDETPAEMRARLDEHERAVREKRKIQQKQQLVWESHVERVREAERQAELDRIASAKAKALELEKRAASKQQRLEAESAFFASKEQQRVVTKQAAERHTEQTTVQRQQSWKAKSKQLQERDEHVRQEREEQRKAMAVRARLAQIDRADHENRRLRQTSFKRDQQLAKMQSSEERLSVLARERESQRKLRHQLLQKTELENEKILKQFTKMRGKIRGDMPEDSLKKLGISPDILAAASNNDSNNHHRHSNSLSASYARTSSADIERSPYRKPVSMFTHPNSASHKAKASDRLNHNQSPDSARHSRISSSSLAHLSPPAGAHRKHPHELSLDERAEMLEQLSLRQNGDLLMAVEQEQQREDERDRLVAGAVDDEELERLERVFAVERGISSEKIERLQRQHEITLAMKMQELGLIIDDEDPSLDPQHDHSKHSEEQKECEADNEASLISV